MRLLPILALGLAACLSGADAQVSTPQEQAGFLAGLPLPRTSPLRPLQLSPEYRAYQEQLRDQWSFCRQVRYEAMRRWGTEHLAAYPAARGVLRYLFGGPDFLNAYAFFPDTSVMVLGGLEPVGEVPPPEALSPSSLGVALQSLDQALHTSLFAGYFITTEMRPQLTAGAFRGVLPVLYTEVALTGNLVDSVSMERPFGSPGVKITYHRPGGPAQTLWYFQADLSNGKECRRFLAWLGEIGPGASYLKAASYLLPRDTFSETRNFLIRTSEMILQDDSGLPYRCFLPGIWRISLFGVYTDPLEIFRLGRDPALSEAFDSPLRVAPLAFGAGYHVNGTDANLLLAVRDSSVFTQGNPLAVAPAAVPAFAVTTPTPGRIRIKKAKPVPIRKAIPVTTPRPLPVIAPVIRAVPAATAVVVPRQRIVTPPPSLPAATPNSHQISVDVPQAVATPAPESSPVVHETPASTPAGVAPEATPLAKSEPSPVPAIVAPPPEAVVPPSPATPPVVPVESETPAPAATEPLPAPAVPDVPQPSPPVSAVPAASEAPTLPDGKPID